VYDRYLFRSCRYRCSFRSLSKPCTIVLLASDVPRKADTGLRSNTSFSSAPSPRSPISPSYRCPESPTFPRSRPFPASKQTPIGARPFHTHQRRVSQSQKVSVQAYHLPPNRETTFAAPTLSPSDMSCSSHPPRRSKQARKGGPRGLESEKTSAKRP
jgi:hypothetical protein